MIDRHTSTWSSWFLATGLSLGVHALAFASVLVFEPESRAKPGTTTIDLVTVSFGADVKAVDATTNVAPTNKAEAVKAVKAEDKVKPTASAVTEQVRPDTTRPERQEAQRLEKANTPSQPVTPSSAPDKAAQVSETEKALQATAAETANRAPPAETVASSAVSKRVAAAPAPDPLQETAQAAERVQANDAGTTPPSAATPQKPTVARPEQSAPRPAAAQAKQTATDQRVQAITVARAETSQPPAAARPKTVLPENAQTPAPVQTSRAKSSSSPSRVETVTPKSVQSALPTAAEPPKAARKSGAAALKTVANRVAARVSDQPSTQTRVKNTVSAARPKSSQPSTPDRVQSSGSAARPSTPTTVTNRVTARVTQRPAAQASAKNAVSAVRPQSSQSAAPSRVQSSGTAARVSGAKPVEVARLSVPADRAKPPPASVPRNSASVSAPARVKTPSVAAKPASAAPVASKPLASKPVTSAPATSAVRPKAVAQKATTKVAAIGPVEPSSEPSAQATTGTGPRTVPLESLQSFDSGECMLILPRTAGSMRTAFSAFGLRPYTAELFQREMERRHAVDLSISMSPLADAQCAVTEFVRSLPSYPLFSIRIELDRDVIKSGETLRGYLRDATGQLSLILIDDEGFAHNVNQFLSLDGFDVVLSAPMHVTGQPVRTAQMFLAISAPQSLNTLADRSSRTAAEFFQALSVELEVKGVAIDVAVAAFRVE